jgi:hypothetical protein
MQRPAGAPAMPPQDLSPGLFDHPLSTAVHQALAGSEDSLHQLQPLEPAEAPQRLARYLRQLSEIALASLPEAQRQQQQLALVNRIVALLQQQAPNAISEGDPLPANLMRSWKKLKTTTKHSRTACCEAHSIAPILALLSVVATRNSGTGRVELRPAQDRSLPFRASIGSGSAAMPATRNPVEHRLEIWASTGQYRFHKKNLLHSRAECFAAESDRGAHQRSPQSASRAIGHQQPGGLEALHPSN